MSGGGLQKPALARTFFRSGELVILDEPSSSLDALSEKKLSERIFALKQGVTTLMITHRLSDMDKCGKMNFPESIIANPILAFLRPSNIRAPGRGGRSNSGWHATPSSLNAS